MNRKIGLVTATAIGFLALAASSQASAQAFGSAAYNTYRDCSTADPSGVCDGTVQPDQRIVTSVLTGGVSSTANSSLVLSGQTVTGPGGLPVTLPGDGSYANSSVTFGAFDLPEIRGATSSGLTERMNVNAFGYQTYTYDGTPGSSTPFSITGDLHIVSWDGNAVLDTPTQFGGAYAGGVIATGYVGIWDTSILSSFTDAQSIFNSLFLAQCGSSPSILGMGSSTATFNGSGLDGHLGATTNACNADGTLGTGPITLLAGQTVLVVAGIQLPTNRGGMIDATHTFTTAFTPDLGIDVDHLESGASILASAAPEPATWGLMLMGFFGLGSALRRRRSVLVA